MKALLLVFHFITAPDTLPPQYVLESSIDSFFVRKSQAEITEFQSSTKYDWMRWLPSVGIGYALDGKPRPVANYSVDRFYSNFKTKETNKLKTESLKRIAHIEAQKLKFELRILLKKHTLLKSEIQLMEKNIALDDEILTIETDRYNRKETLPTEFLRIKQANQAKHQELFLKQNELQLLEAEILNRCFVE